MVEVKVSIPDKDRKVGAMVKALAVEVSGYKAVSGATGGSLMIRGYLSFHFPSQDKAADFENVITKYIPSKFAQVVNPKPDSGGGD